MTEQPKDNDNVNWLQRVVRHFSGQKRDGDVIAAHIGEDSQNVVVGKNIIQIGALKIPYWVIALMVIGIIIGVGALVYDSYKGRGEADAITGQLEEIGQVVLATTTPMPTVTPVPTATPLRMPDGQFNIAVTEFSVIGDDEQLTGRAELQEFSESVAKFLDNQEDVLTEVIGEQVLIWGPSLGIPPVEAGKEAEFAISLNADVLLYGELRPADEDRWTVYPKFYLTDGVVGRAYELQGEHRLGAGIDYRLRSTASRRDVNTSLRMRLEALSQMLLGLSYMAFGENEGYARSSEVFQSIVEDTEWGQQTNGTGQEVLYLFLGNSYLGQSFVTDDIKPEREEFLIQARTAFSSAISLDPMYARSYNGLGSTLFQLARPTAEEFDCDWDWGLLNQAAQQYETAVDLPEEDKPPSGQVDYRANFGLGRAALFQGMCQDPAKWENARGYYEYVIDEFQKMKEPIPHLVDIVAYAHADLGVINLIEADEIQQTGAVELVGEAAGLLEQSISHYGRSVALTRQSGTEDGEKHALEIMPYYLTALCIGGQENMASHALNDFLQNRADNEKTVAYLQQRTPVWGECIDDENN